MLKNGASCITFKICIGYIYLPFLTNIKIATTTTEFKQKGQQRGIFISHYDNEQPYFSTSPQYTGKPVYGSNLCLQGICIAREQCISLKGHARSPCIAGSFKGGVCCQGKPCIQQTAENSSSFTNPSYPQGETKPINCEITMVTRQTSCAVRIDFHEARLTPSLNTWCYEDSLTILVNPSIGTYNTLLCGYLNGYSTIVQLTTTSEVKIIIITQSNGALWRIQLTQIECADIKLPGETTCGFQTQQFRKIENTVPTDQNNRTMLQQKTFMYTKIRKNEIIRARMVTQVESTTDKKIMKDNIFRGQEAVPHRYPWIVALLLDSVPRCSASIITRNWLLTAGHCTALTTSETPPINRFTVLLGAHDISSPEPSTMTQTLSNIVQHSSLLGVNYDIALLKPSESILYSSTIRPICLPTAGGIISPAQPVLAGWGNTGNGMPSSVLLESSTQLISKTTCQGAWTRSSVAIADYMICTTPQGCNGDSGGPLMVSDENELYYAVGIVSFGAQTCGDPTLPQVYIKVHSFLQWIATAMVDKIQS